MSLRPISGLSLWNIAFRGQRIAYEVSLQELFIAYNSYSGAGATYFLVGLCTRAGTHTEISPKHRSNMHTKPYVILYLMESPQKCSHFCF